MRRAHLLLIIAIAVGLGLHVNATPAAGCMCVLQTSVQHVARADVVFAGLLMEIDAGVRGLVRSSMDPITYRFEVERVFKGAVPENASVVSAARRRELRARADERRRTLHGLRAGGRRHP